MRALEKGHLRRLSPMLFVLLFLISLSLHLFSATSAESSDKSGKSGDKEYEGIIYQEADESIYDQRKKMWLLRGDVKIYYKDGVLFCDEMRIDTEKEIAWGEGNVRLLRPNAFLKSEKVELRYGDKIAIFSGNVEATFKEEVEGQRISSPVKIVTPWLKYDLENEEGYTDKGVTIHYRDYVVNAPLMWWSSSQKKIILKGGVKGRRGEDEISADKVIIYTSQDKVEMKGHVKIKVFYTKEKEEFYRAEYRRETREEQAEEEEELEISKPEALDRMEAIRIKLKSDMIKGRILSERGDELLFSLPLGFYLKFISRKLMGYSSPLGTTDLEDFSSFLRKACAQDKLRSAVILGAPYYITSENLRDLKSLGPYLTVAVAPGLELIPGKSDLITPESTFTSLDDMARTLEEAYTVIKGSGFSPCLFISKEGLRKALIEEVNDDTISKLMEINRGLSGGASCLAMTLKDYISYEDLVSDSKAEKLILYINGPQDIFLLERRGFQLKLPENVNLLLLADYKGLDELLFNWNSMRFNYSSPDLKYKFYLASSWLALKLKAVLLIPPSDVLSPSEASLSPEETIRAVEKFSVSGPLKELKNRFRMSYGGEI